MLKLDLRATKSGCVKITQKKIDPGVIYPKGTAQGKLHPEFHLSHEFTSRERPLPAALQNCNFGVYTTAD